MRAVCLAVLAIWAMYYGTQVKSLNINIAMTMGSIALALGAVALVVLGM